MSSNKPTVFVSSTCYDLKQIRQDLEHFLKDELGFEPLLSESDSFPVDPQLSTTENCTRIVDEHADIFILIVGCRYGNPSDTGQSVTNLEYLHAKQKNIPIYVYIDKSIIANLSVWKENPNASFQSVVDTPKLFEFVDSIRSIESVWSNPFEHAKDIIDNLRSRLAYLFLESLKVRSLIKRTKLTKNLRSLSGEALSIFLTKPIGWEFRLFSAILCDEIVDLEDKRRDLNYGISYSEKRQFDSDLALLDYMTGKISQLETLAGNIATQINNVHKVAIGAPGEHGDADLIVYNAKSIASIYSAFIDWSLDGYKILPTSDQEDIVKCISEVCKPTLRDIERFIEDCKLAVKDIPSTLSSTENPKVISTCLTLSDPNVEGLNKAIVELARKYDKS